MEVADQLSRVFSPLAGRIGLRSLRYWMLLTFGQSGFAMLFPLTPSAGVPENDDAMSLRTAYDYDDAVTLFRTMKRAP